MSASEKGAYFTRPVRVTISATEPRNPSDRDRWVDARDRLWEYRAEDMGGGWVLLRVPGDDPLADSCNDWCGPGTHHMPPCPNGTESEASDA